MPHPLEAPFQNLCDELADAAPLHSAALIHPLSAEVLASRGDHLRPRADALAAAVRAHRDLAKDFEALTAKYADETLVFRTLSDSAFVVVSLPPGPQGVVATETILNLRSDSLSLPPSPPEPAAGFDFEDWLTSWREAQDAR